MSFVPEVLQPTPEPWFVRELKLIDPALQVVFGYARYLKRCWMIERKVTNERYYTLYRSLIEEDAERFVDQPIFDTNQPLYDEEGNPMGWRIVGYRRYDLAPEWEWLMTIETKDGKYKPLSTDDLISLRRQYAWNVNHPFSRYRYEEEQRKADEAKERDKERKLKDAVLEGMDEAFHESGKIVVL